jgi:hypothetical protein
VELLGALRKLGVLTQSQMMREAYPGAIYRYCGDLFRVIGSRDAKILVRVEHAHFTKTTPNLQTIAFPAWTAGGQIRIAADRSGFVARTPLQISQRVIGFTERNGQHTQSHAYETGGVWAQRPLVRVFPTTGVVFTASHLPEAAGDFILRAYAFLEGIHARDLGVGPFFARSQPTGEAGEVKGLAIFDNVQGGLDLTKNLAPRFAECLTEAIRLAKLEGPENDSVVQALATLAKQVPGFVLCGMGGAGPSGSPAGADDGWIAGLIAPGEKGLVGTDEVSVLGILNGREGIRYQLARPDEPTVKWTVGKQQITPLPGSRECRFHPDTGEIQITP